MIGKSWHQTPPRIRLALVEGGTSENRIKRSTDNLLVHRHNEDSLWFCYAFWSVKELWNPPAPPVLSNVFSSSQCFRIENHPILICGVRAMPLGTICQLNYYGGGRLQYQDSCGKPLHLSFEKAPCLRISQQVSFSINHILSEASNVVPVDLPQAEVTKSAVETEGSESFTCAAIRGESQGRAVGDLPASSGSMRLASKLDSGGAKAKEDRPGRKLQRSIGEYHNADMQERLQLITRAEETLQELLAAAEIDGDALGRLVCRCVGWLHAPLLSENGHPVDTETDPSLDASTSSENSNLQSRLRRLLIRALSHLDLTDDVTRAALETALMYIQGLIKAVPLWSDASTKRVTKQWQALQSLVSTSHRRPPTHSQVAKPEERKGVRKDWATTAGGTFQPGQKILKLPSVSTRNHGIRLTCSHCGHEISSKWFWRHPATGIVHVLAPYNGHSACSRKLGKKVRWIVDGDMPQKNDHFTELDLCPHHREKGRCQSCGGDRLCLHGRRPNLCPLCRKSYLMRRIYFCEERYLVPFKF